MAAAKHTKLTLTTPPENAAVAHGTPFTVLANGETDDTNVNHKTSVFIRVFYRVGGFPFAVDVYNDEAAMGGAGVKQFNLVAGKTAPFTPVAKKPHSIRMLAWDNRAGSKVTSLADIRQKVHRFRVA